MRLLIDVAFGSQQHPLILSRRYAGGFWTLFARQELLMMIDSPDSCFYTGKSN